jgi:hypothetical protein
LANVAGLGFAVGNSETWAFRFDLSVTVGGASIAYVGVTASAGAPTLEAQVLANADATRMTAINSTTGSPNLDPGTNLIHVTGVVIATSSGACTIYPGICGSSGNAVTVYANSVSIATRIP